MESSKPVLKGSPVARQARGCSSDKVLAKLKNKSSGELDRYSLSDKDIDKVKEEIEKRGDLNEMVNQIVFEPKKKRF